MGQAKIVKRYANRKLYDTERSCYVTLDDISAMITAGDEVKVIDNKSGEDLTSVTLAQIIFETEKKKSFMPLGLLRDLIQNPGDSIQDMYRDGLGKAQEKVKEIRGKAERLRDDAKTNIEGAINKSTEQARVPVDSAKSMVESSHRALDELQKGVEQRIKGGVGLLGRELDNLRERLTELEARLDREQN
jgi:polyhydroxyalkanoate synthesis repressor PhaR